MVCIYLAPNGQDELHPNGSPLPRTTTRATTCAGAGRSRSTEGRRSSGHLCRRRVAALLYGGRVSTEIELNVLAPVRARPRWSDSGSAPCRKNLTRTRAMLRTPAAGVLAIPLSTARRWLSIGPGQKKRDPALLIGENIGWVRNYRGLWVFRRTPLPARMHHGPMFNHQWHRAPLLVRPWAGRGWTRVAPGAELLTWHAPPRRDHRASRQAARTRRREDGDVARADVQAAAMRNQPHLQRITQTLGDIDKLARDRRYAGRNHRRRRCSIARPLRTAPDARRARSAARPHPPRPHTRPAQPGARRPHRRNLGGGQRDGFAGVAFVVLFSPTRASCPSGWSRSRRFFAFIEASVRGTLRGWWAASPQPGHRRRARPALRVLLVGRGAVIIALAGYIVGQRAN